MSEMIAPAKPATNGKPQVEAAPKPRRYDYDIVIIGSGPAGHRAAIQSAKLGKRVAVIEKKTLIGGVSVNTGTIPSKTLREAVLHLSGFRQRSIYGASYMVKENITMNDLLLRADHVIRHEIEINKHQLQRKRRPALRRHRHHRQRAHGPPQLRRAERRRRTDDALHHDCRGHDRGKARRHPL